MVICFYCIYIISKLSLIIFTKIIESADVSVIWTVKMLYNLQLIIYSHKELKLFLQ
jgi:hypothetical protein